VAGVELRQLQEGNRYPLQPQQLQEIRDEGVNAYYTYYEGSVREVVLTPPEVRVVLLQQEVRKQSKLMDEMAAQLEAWGYPGFQTSENLKVVQEVRAIPMKAYFEELELARRYGNYSHALALIEKGSKVEENPAYAEIRRELRLTSAASYEISQATAKGAIKETLSELRGVLRGAGITVLSGVIAVGITAKAIQAFDHQKATAPEAGSASSMNAGVFIRQPGAVRPQ
jgi:hypothetical protein